MKHLERDRRGHPSALIAALVAALSAAGLSACACAEEPSADAATSDTAGKTDVGGVDGADSDSDSDANNDPGDASDDAPDGSDAGAGDGMGDADGEAGAATCPGGFGCSCASNSDCDSAFCLETPDGLRCSQTCIEFCPADHSCVPAPGADAVFICQHRFARHCAPCAENKDCNGNGLLADRCVPMGDAGAFCGSGCGADALPCPQGTACQATKDVDGVATKQCLPVDGEGAAAPCPCTAMAVALAAKTTCVKAIAGGGSCKGDARCLQAGAPATCEAVAAVAEVCDGVDSDCDGATDEASCDDGNPCTTDGCDAATGCWTQPLPAKALCTLPDASTGWCQAGVCVDKPKPGSACLAGGDCSSGYCVDGVCCDGPCQGACQACALAATGVKDGQCAPVSAGKDPDDECAAADVSTCGLTGACDGAGACQSYAAGTECAPATCSDKGEVVGARVCGAAGCGPGKVTACITSKPCHQSVCKEAQCVVEPSTAPCDDGDVCTKADACALGACQGQPGGCDDGNACTTDICKGNLGCAHEQLKDEAFCSVDEQKWCKAGACVLRIAGIDCAHAKAVDPQRPSGVYLVDPDNQGPHKPFSVYCDMASDGGGWTLMSLFGQHKGVVGVDQARYEKIFANSPIWIEGGAEGKPMAPEPTYDDFTFHSHDWRQILVKDGAYQLRQEAKTQVGLAFDVAYRFRYNGRVLQDGAPKAERVWTLADRKVLKDASGVPWDIAEGPARFWLPFTLAAAGEQVFTACFGAQFGAPCEGDLQTVLSVTRRFGNAGITGQVGDSKDPALSWAPHMNGQKSALDIAWQHQSEAAFHATAKPMALRYWSRGLCGDKVVQDGEHCDDGGRDGGDGCDGLCRFEPTPSCFALRSKFPAAKDGVYAIDADGAGPLPAVDLFCDMRAGGWTLVANLVDGPLDDLPADPQLLVSGFGQVGDGAFEAVPARVDRVAAPANAKAPIAVGTGAAALAPAMVATLAAAGSGGLGGQSNLAVCLVGAPGAVGSDGSDAAGPDLDCRRLGDASLAAPAWAPASVKHKALAALAGQATAQTYARLLGLAGSAASTDPALLTTGAFALAVAPGGSHGFGSAGKLSEASVGTGCQGVWHAEGDGVAYRPGAKGNDEVGGCLAGGGKGLPDAGGWSGVRLWVGPPLDLGAVGKPAASCQAIVAAGKSRGSGRYQLQPAGAKAAAWYHCEMVADGGGWTQVVRVAGGSAEHGGKETAVGDSEAFVGPFKLDDAAVNALTTGAGWRYACGDAYRALIFNAGKGWTSKKSNGLIWVFDRDRDGGFECQGDDGGGYGFSEGKGCGNGWTRFVAKAGLDEGGGCYVDGKGWGQAGGVWAR